MTRIRNLRWWIAIVLGTVIALNYVDRQSFPVAVLAITRHIPISNKQYGELQALFLLAYAVMYAGGGKLIDMLGTRTGYAIMILWWSAATFLQGMVHGVFELGVARVLLGLGEGGGFPGAAKAVSEWSPPQERALAFGIFTAGSSIGPAIAVPLVAGIILAFGWRWVFFLTGLLGFIWVLAWWLLYDSPEKHKRITPQEREYILDSLAAARKAANGTEQPRIKWSKLFGYRQLWGIILPKFFTDAAWFFLIFWLPKYLGEVRHLNIQAIAYYAWIPYAASGFGCLAGGWLSGHLIGRGLTLDHSRKISLAIGVALVAPAVLITRSPLSLVIVLFSLALLGHQFWSTVLQTLAADMFPSSSVGSVAGIMGSVGSAGAMLFNLMAGALLNHYRAYPTLFLMVALLYPLSLAIIWLVAGRIKPVPLSALGTGGGLASI